MRRFRSWALLGTIAVISGLLLGGCYMPPTPTPHLGQTIGPGAEATSSAQPLGLPTPGITIKPGATVSQPAAPPAVIEQTPLPTPPSPQAPATDTPASGGLPQTAAPRL